MVITIYSISAASAWGWIGNKYFLFKRGERYMHVGLGEKMLKILGRAAITKFNIPASKEKELKAKFPLGVWIKISQADYNTVLALSKDDAVTPPQEPVVASPAPPVQTPAPKVTERLFKPSEIQAQKRHRPAPAPAPTPVVVIEEKPMKPSELLEKITAPKEEPKAPEVVELKKEEPVEVKEEVVEAPAIEEKVEEKEEPKVEEEKEIASSDVEKELENIETNVKKSKKKNKKSKK